MCSCKSSKQSFRAAQADSFMLTFSRYIYTGCRARMQDQAYTVGDTGLARLHLYDKIITDIYMALMESNVRWKWHHEYRLLQI